MKKFTHYASNHMGFVTTQLKKIEYTASDRHYQVICSHHSGGFGEIVWDGFNRSWTTFLPVSGPIRQVHGFKTQKLAVEFLLRYHEFRI